MTGWRLLNDVLAANGPFAPVNNVQYGSQVFHNKNEFGMNGAAQFRSILRALISHLSWAGKVVTQRIKALEVNEFIFCAFVRSARLQSRREMRTDSTIKRTIASG